VNPFVEKDPVKVEEFQSRKKRMRKKPKKKLLPNLPLKRKLREKQRRVNKLLLSEIHRLLKYKIFLLLTVLLWLSKKLEWEEVVNKKRVLKKNKGPKKLNTEQDLCYLITTN
jgi:hypothetical protein